MHVPILTRAAEAQVKSIGENQLECVCMYGLTPWIISPIDPHHCDLHKTHLFDQSLHMQPIRCSFSSPSPPPPFLVCINNVRRVIKNTSQDLVKHIVLVLPECIFCGGEPKWLMGRKKALWGISLEKRKLFADKTVWTPTNRRIYIA